AERDIAPASGTADGRGRVDIAAGRLVGGLLSEVGRVTAACVDQFHALQAHAAVAAILLNRPEDPLAVATVADHDRVQSAGRDGDDAAGVGTAAATEDRAA